MAELFLFEKIDTLKNFGDSYKNLPEYIRENLNPALELRPYQESAFCNYITYFENPKLKQRPNQTLFHMATGSGKTLIMAGLMLYLYKQGYRNFLFFVNLSNIVRKTKENFLTQTSSKYLFAKDVTIEGEHIKIKEVFNFQNTDKEAINICFTTIQGLHSDMFAVKENNLSFDDFNDKKVVLISDEAHHLSANTKRIKKGDAESNAHWENTVNAILGANKENVLLEFTATCDLKDPDIVTKYKPKIIFDYPLAKFRDDLYSKEIKTLRTDSPVFERSLQAVLLSQYRLKIFQDHRLDIKPVILLKSRLVKENTANMEDFIEGLSALTGKKIKDVFDTIREQVPILQEAYNYFVENEISFEQLAQEIKEDFSATHCLSANDDKEVEKNQLLLNTLEDKKNPYRAIFAVDKLNEGWDVLNLFDIVRLYETRDGKNGKPGSGTISEAQLIGRGARYCPFRVEEERPKYQRKYDHDVENRLRICETLYYHCWNEPRYISELHTALREIGLNLDNVITLKHRLKDSFKADEIYRTGLVFVNKRIPKNRNDVHEIPAEIRNKSYQVRIAVGQGGEGIVWEDVSSDVSVQTHSYQTSFKKIAAINYSTVNKALRQFPVFAFNTLRSYYPNVKSTYDFVMDARYLGNIHIEIISKEDVPSMRIQYQACVKALSEIAQKISATKEDYEGSSEFKAYNLNELIKEKSVNYTSNSGSQGVSQNDPSVGNNRLDLSNEDWFAFEDNFGTSEEKAFVAYFKSHIEQLKTQYNKVFLIRNERQLRIYSFDKGECFEPDYLLILQKENGNTHEQIQVFIEPKGAHLIACDSWKEVFLLKLKSTAKAVTITENEHYKIWGFHFFNSTERNREFNEDMLQIL